MLEINKKEDILIPFVRIGDQGWEVNTKIILESIAETWDDELKELVSLDELEKTENRLAAALPDELKIFYQTFGIADIGEQLQGLDEMGWLKDIWADQPQYGPDFSDRDKDILPHLVTFSDYLGNGNLFCFHSETKEIYYYDHDGEPYLTKLFNTVDEYIKGCLILAQVDLFGQADQEQVEEWTEDIVSGFFGEDTVKKWRY